MRCIPCVHRKGLEYRRGEMLFVLKGTLHATLHSDHCDGVGSVVWSPAHPTPLILSYNQDHGDVNTRLDRRRKAYHRHNLLQQELCDGETGHRHRLAGF